jgi:hypothetical protein
MFICHFNAMEERRSSDHTTQCTYYSIHPRPASGHHRHGKVLWLVTNEDRPKLHARCNWQSVVHFEGTWLHSNKRHLRRRFRLAMMFHTACGMHKQADHVCAMPTCPMAFCRRNSRLCHANASSLVLPSRRPYASGR